MVRGTDFGNALLFSSVIALVVETLVWDANDSPVFWGIVAIASARSWKGTREKFKLLIRRLSHK